MKRARYTQYHLQSEAGIVRGKGSGKARSERIDLGLAALSLCCVYGVPLTNHDQACWTEVSESAIQQIETKALHKLRKAMEMRGDPLLAELIEAAIGLGAERTPAVKVRSAEVR